MSEPEEDSKKKNYELIFGVIVTVFAAILALNELASGKYGDDELQLNSEKTSAYLWYQSKGIKETLTEGQRDLLKALISGGLIASDKSETVAKQVGDLDKKITRYGKEKNEILLGSEAVGKENWAQEINGELGQVTGVKQTERKLERLGAAGDRFDLATLFLQLSLVLGAIGIILTQISLKKVFLAAMIFMGTAGAVCGATALRIAGFF
jgi:hypothetical protein